MSSAQPASAPNQEKDLPCEEMPHHAPPCFDTMELEILMMETRSSLVEM
jgi:hypothetical protein